MILILFFCILSFQTTSQSELLAIFLQDTFDTENAGKTEGVRFVSAGKLQIFCCVPEVGAENESMMLLVIVLQDLLLFLCSLAVP